MSDRTLADVICGLELRLLDPRTRRSRADLEALLADDFVEFGSSGRVFDRESIIAAFASETSIAFEVADFRAVALAPDVVLATYRAIARGVLSSRDSLRSSVWVRRADRWQMIFHQGTPTTRPEEQA